MTEEISSVVEQPWSLRVQEALGRLRVGPAAALEEGEAVFREMDEPAVPRRWPLPARAAREARELELAGKLEDFGLAEKMAAAEGALVALVGPPGSGKTVVAAAEGLRWQARHRRAGYATLRALGFEFESALRGERGPTRWELLIDLAGLPLLILDECSRGMETEAEKRLVTELLDARFRELRPTVLISNHGEWRGTGAARTFDAAAAGKAFAAWAGPSITDRMAECGGIIYCGGPSHRQLAAGGGR